MDDKKDNGINNQSESDVQTKEKRVKFITMDSELFDISCLKALSYDFDVYEVAYDSLYKSVLIASAMARYNEPQEKIYQFLRQAANDAENAFMLHLGIQRRYVQIADNAPFSFENSGSESVDKY